MQEKGIPVEDIILKLRRYILVKSGKEMSVNTIFVQNEANNCLHANVSSKLKKVFWDLF